VYSLERAICDQASFHELGILGQNHPVLTKSCFDHSIIVFLPEQQSIIAHQPQPSSQSAHIVIGNEFDFHSSQEQR
jgi:hypothetical protein